VQPETAEMSSSVAVATVTSSSANAATLSGVADGGHKWAALGYKISKVIVFYINKNAHNPKGRFFEDLRRK
jgi:hypothetical protein